LGVRLDPLGDVPRVHEVGRRAALLHVRLVRRLDLRRELRRRRARQLLRLVPEPAGDVHVDRLAVGVDPLVELGRLREAADVDQPPRHLGHDVGDPLGHVVHCELDGVLPRLCGGEWVG
jgi:hypothetical protein